jgi:hypothetical protein
MKKLLLILLSGLIISCGGEKKIKNSNEVTFTQVGYFKSDNKYRCFAYTFDKDDEKQILAHAKTKMNTSGRTTQVYYFNELAAGIGDKITLSNSFFDAMELCLDLDWKYEYSIYPNGKENFRKK